MLNKAYINLNNLKDNVKSIKSKLNCGVKFCAVIKAEAYGHGSVECANAIYKDVDCFAVALLEEAVKLRQAGIEKEILMLLPAFDKETITAVENDLTLSGFTKEHLYQAERAAKELNKRVRFHIKYDSGMNRLGVKGQPALKRLLNFAKKCPHVEIAGVFSHFACPESDEMRDKAYKEFLLAKSIVKAYNSNAVAHISSSGGFLKGVQEDMVRIGILLYGYSPFSSKINLKPVMSLSAPTISVRKVEKGQSALYGEKIAKRQATISIIRYGYADGLFRKEINGQFNNRCMDLTAVNGKRKNFSLLKNVTALAAEYNTISYEILTKVALRAEKIYIR